MITSQLCPGLPPPPVFAGEQDVGPSERRDMREQCRVTIQPGPLPRGHGLTEVLGVPVDDDGGEQVETGHAVVLTLIRLGQTDLSPPDQLARRIAVLDESAKLSAVVGAQVKANVIASHAPT